MGLLTVGAFILGGVMERRIAPIIKKILKKIDDDKKYIN